MSSFYCPTFLTSWIPDSEATQQRILDNMQGDTDKLEEELQKNQRELGELRTTMQCVRDTSTPMSNTGGLTRKDIQIKTEARILEIMKDNKLLENQLRVFTKARKAVLTTKRTKQLATQVDTLNKQLKTIGGVDTSQLTENMDSLAEAEFLAHDVAQTMDDTMNAWGNDNPTEDERLLAEFYENMGHDTVANLPKPVENVKDEEDQAHEKTPMIEHESIY